MPNLLDRIVARAFDDIQAEVSIAPNSTNNKILSFRTPPGLRGFITNFGQAFDAALNTFVKFYLRANQTVVFPYNALFAQICPPEQTGLIPLPFPIPVEQLTLIEVFADVGAAAQSGNFTGRVIAKYYDPKDVR